jgi:hypothetical protein
LIFAFAVRRLRWLAAIPGLPQIFDALLLGWSALFSPARVRAISDLEAAVTTWPGMRPGNHRFGGVGFFFHDRECGHIHGNGLLDCFVGRTNRDALVQSGAAAAHHIFPHSGWISFWIENADDLARAIELVRIAARYRQDAR